VVKDWAKRAVFFINYGSHKCSCNNEEYFPSKWKIYLKFCNCFRFLHDSITSFQLLLFSPISVDILFYNLLLLHTIIFGSHASWTRTILVAFVDIPCTSWDCINLLFSGLAKPEYVGDIRLTRRVMLRHNKTGNFIFWLYFSILCAHND
jgi:hypothetical protein